MKTKAPKKGRPPIYVRLNNQTVKGLSLKSDGRYYSTHNHPKTRLRIYFGYELDGAVRAFRSWQRKVLA